ncbi:hypothetical protein [Paraburkholderia sp. SIMBA_054]|uniref:hypothetical protein n=1 Tax=Paraburkholderia sp. SIMBA_054 TaxID=3085795 RepID=UPI00397CC373
MNNSNMTSESRGALVGSRTLRVTAFTTSKGSIYTVHEDDTTSRNKAYRPEHGRDEVGQQPRSQHTFYVTQEQADALSLVQTHGSAKCIARLSTGQYGVAYMSGKDAGKIERRTVVDAAATPAIGLLPVEVWEGGSRVHFGNNIVAVQSAG